MGSFRLVVLTRQIYEPSVGFLARRGLDGLEPEDDETAFGPMERTKSGLLSSGGGGS